MEEVAIPYPTKHNKRSDRERFFLFIKHTPAAVAMFDKKMNYLAASDQWLEDYGIRKKDIVGRSFYEVSPELSQKWKEIHSVCLTGISMQKEEDRIERANAEDSWIKWNIQPWREASGETGGIIMFTEDITSQKQTEMTLLKARELAEETSLSKTKFISSMSHEFKTPLTSILGFAELLEEETSLSEEQQSFVREIKNSGNNLLTLVDEVLNLSKMEFGKIEYENGYIVIRRLLKKITDEFALKYADRENKTVIGIEDSVPEELIADENKMNQILSRLIENAHKFTRKGDIQITAGYEKVEHTGIEGGYLTVSVSDTGLGIPEDKVNKVFNSFVKIGERYNDGIGLGLTVVSSLCRFMGGSCEAESEAGKGSTFTVRIPVKVGELEAVEGQG